MQRSAAGGSSRCLDEIAAAGGWPKLGFCFIQLVVLLSAVIGSCICRLWWLCSDLEDCPVCLQDPAQAPPKAPPSSPDSSLWTNFSNPACPAQQTRTWCEVTRESCCSRLAAYSCFITTRESHAISHENITKMEYFPPSLLVCMQVFFSIVALALQLVMPSWSYWPLWSSTWNRVSCCCSVMRNRSFTGQPLPEWPRALH